MGSEADGGGAIRAVHGGTGAVRIVVGAPGGPGEPRDPGVPSGPGGPRESGDPSNPGIEREAGAASGGVPQVEQAPHAPGPDGDAAPAAGGPGNQLTLTVPFPSPMEAEIAHRFLTPNAQLRGPVQKELSVDGSVLTVRLTAEDPGQLRISITSCLDQVSLVIRTIQRIVPPFFAKPQQDKGG
uniref:L antigen family member 3 n=1 Tax=Ursus americanus TaxID=9643 RepID=A0A452R7B8_URSAM